jgi:transcriptional regulator
MGSEPLSVLQGTLDLLVLRALTWGTMHGYAIMRWIRQSADGELEVEDAALYPSLHRLEVRGLIEAEWGLSENKRKARFYRITPIGRRALRAELESWRRYVKVVARVMENEA